MNEQEQRTRLIAEYARKAEQGVLSEQDLSRWTLLLDQQFALLRKAAFSDGDDFVGWEV
jgi:hypothetical protein